MDRLDAMRVFTRVVEQRSFTRAAERLALPRSTATDAIRQLEARLGVRLLERTTRHVRPTLDGEAYYQRCLAILADVEDADTAFAGASPRGLLRVDAHGTLARHVVLPRLPAFLARHPDLQIHLGEGDRLVDLVREGIDCAVRVGVPRDADLAARRLGLLTEVTCASPAYLERAGMPADLDDLAGHQMVGFASSATGGILPLEFRVRDALLTRHLPHPVTVAAADSYVAAARQGLGLVQVPRYHVDADLADGTLIEVLPAMRPDPSPVSLLYPRNRQMSPRLRVFIDWLVEVFGSDRTL